MLFRKLKLDWSYAIGELIIVTAGVLIALAINEWNTGREERAKEKVIIKRLITDIEEDIEYADRALWILDSKLESLSRVKTQLDLGIQSVADPEQFVGDFWRGQGYGWGQDRAIQATFNELMGAGDYRLIRNPDLRAEISQYYFFRIIEGERMNARESGFPHIVYRLIPYSVRDPESATYFGSPDTEELVKRIFSADVEGELLGEMNYAYFTRRDFSVIRRVAESLSESLKSELQALE